MGKFQPGHKLAKGRPLGSKNKRTDLFAICDEKGVDLFQEALTIALTTTDTDKRFGMIKELLPYVYPKKKEVLNLADTPVEELLNVAEQKLKDEPA